MRDIVEKLRHRCKCLREYGEERCYPPARRFCHEDSEAADEIERLREVSGPMDWQPIETAPKDGTKFIAYEPTYGAGSCFYQTITTGSYADEVETVSGWRLHGMMFREGDIDQPTCWQPLPEPPSQ